MLALTCPLVLASASPRRVELLKQIGIAPDHIIPADIDETPSRDEAPGDYCLRVALEKARAIRPDNQNCLILAADTTASTGRRIFGKPEDRQDAERMIRHFSGRAHHIYGGIALITPSGQEMTRGVATRVQVKHMSEGEISAYLDTGDWDGKAGAYGIQGPFGAFVKGIQGSHSNVVGLCVSTTWKLLHGCGYAQLGG